MSALPPKADMDQQGCDVRFVPEADMRCVGDGAAWCFEVSPSAAVVPTRLCGADSGTREHEIMRQHAECHCDDENDHRQR